MEAGVGNGGRKVWTGCVWSGPISQAFSFSETFGYRRTYQPTDFLWAITYLFNSLSLRSPLQGVAGLRASDD